MADTAHDSITLGTGNIATGVAAGTGIISFLNENAGAISVLIGFASLLIALLFYVLNYRLKRNAHKLDHEEMKQEIIDQIKSELGEEEASPIINKLEKMKDRRKY